jgi:GNAT superfamily N-acetyltransferase
MPYEYFDRYVFECWATYGRSEGLRLFKLKHLDEEGHVRWSAHDEDDHRIYAFEVRDPFFEDRRAWAFVIERDGALEVEELYVRPEYRRLGHGRWLADRVAQLACEKGMPLRLWVAFADCKSESEGNYPSLVATARRLGVQFQACPVPWAAYFGTTEQPGEKIPVGPPMIPERPRAPRQAVLATVMAFSNGAPSTVSSNGTPPALSNHVHVSSDLKTFPKPGTHEWGKMNQRRAELIRKDILGTLTESERIEYENLQKLSLAAMEEVFPFEKPDEERERALEERLSRVEGSGE